MSETASSANPGRVRAAVDRVVRAIPPLWPLSSSVAVNPFLGQAQEELATAGARLARAAGAPVTMPRSWYREKIAAGEIGREDLEQAWKLTPADLRPPDFAALEAAIARDAPVLRPLPTVADLAAEASGIDWPAIVADRIGAWASGFFDEGQALWAAPRGTSAFAAWRAFAAHDLSPQIAGLAGFARRVAECPDSAMATIERVVRTLGAPDDGLESCGHRLLATLGGWAQYARYRHWRAELQGATDSAVVDLLAVRLLWEDALYAQYGSSIAPKWAATCQAHARPVAPTTDLMVDAILQYAAECAAQRRLAEEIAGGSVQDGSDRPALQAAFCIDVRSETFRRALETVGADVQTLGFAGFFGLATAHRRFASDVDELRSPVLLNPAIRTCAAVPDDPSDRSARIVARAQRAWGRFKLSAVSSFAFVEAAGPIYVGKLLGDSLRLHGAPESDEPPPLLDPTFGTEQRVQATEAILRAMSLTSGFARLVLIVGHGASVVNNPHASALQCGACGGYSGETNARLLALLLNDREVRRGLAARGVDIPDDTLFLGALHDTTTDRVTLYAQDGEVGGHAADIARARALLGRAGEIARGERAARLPRADSEAAVARRSRDWSETRPEWGLAGCNAFIAAPRARTKGGRLAGRAFLHDYDWRRDPGFGVLEQIMTAPVVVASWISLQYYGSTVAPDVFGSGNKLLHNVVGGIGALEGNGGLLRGGLPWQSVHDGERYIHDPLRLSVCIEAPPEAIVRVLERHEAVRALFDNRWLHLFTLDEAGRMARRYTGDLSWSDMPVAPACPPCRLAAAAE